MTLLPRLIICGGLLFVIVACTYVMVQMWRLK